MEPIRCRVTHQSNSLREGRDTCDEPLEIHPNIVDSYSARLMPFVVFDGGHYPIVMFDVGKGGRAVAGGSVVGIVIFRYGQDVKLYTDIPVERGRKLGLLPPWP